MPDQNTLVIRVADWIGADWGKATVRARSELLAWFRLVVIAEKKRQIRAEIGANGRKLKPRKKPRADGANGPVLAPHDESSRSEKWIRAHVGLVGGTVSLHWSHGWGKILGYHRAGAGRFGPIAQRNIIDFPVATTRRMQRQTAVKWDEISRGMERRRAAEKARRAPKPVPQPAPQPVPVPQARFTATTRQTGPAPTNLFGGGFSVGGVQRTSTLSFRKRR